MAKKVRRQTTKNLVIAAIVCCVAIGGYVIWRSLQPQQALPTMTPAVNAFVIEPKGIMPEMSFVAKIESPDSVGLRARVTGFLQERLFKEGDVVQEGQPLFLIEKVNFEANVREAEANYTKAEANAQNAKAQYERTKTLFKTKDVSESRLDESKAATQSADAEVAQMKARLDLARQDLDYTVIKAPIAGKVGESKFSVGELIGPESGVLATLVSVNPMDAVFSASENQLSLLWQLFGKQEKIDVRFVDSAGKVYPEKGDISFVDVALDEAMNTLKMKASFPNPDGKLISGQYGRVILKRLTPIDQIVIPLRAVQRDMTSSYVYVITPDNKIEKRIVKTGLELPDFDVVINEGLQSGEKIVLDGFQKIAPQMQVTPVFEAEKQPK